MKFPKGRRGNIPGKWLGTREDMEKVLVKLLSARSLLDVARGLVMDASEVPEFNSQALDLAGAIGDIRESIYWSELLLKQMKERTK